MDGCRVNVLYEETGSDFRLKQHHHNHYEIIYVVSGSASLEISGKYYSIDSSSLVFINKFESHHLTARSYPYSRYFLLIDPSFLYRQLNDPVLLSIFKQRPEHFSHVIAMGRRLGKKVNYVMKKMLEECNQKKAMWESAVGSLLNLLLLQVYRGHYNSFPASAMNDAMETVMRVQSYIDAHYTEDIRLSDISSKFHVDMYYLSRLFSKYTGYTFKEYITLQRISKARDLLYNTSDNITRVSMDSGFNNVNHFIRIFKNHEGLTPLQYRKKVKPNHLTS